MQQSHVKAVGKSSGCPTAPIATVVITASSRVGRPATCRGCLGLNPVPPAHQRSRANAYVIVTQAFNSVVKLTERGISASRSQAGGNATTAGREQNRYAEIRTVI